MNFFSNQAGFRCKLIRGAKSQFAIFGMALSWSFSAGVFADDTEIFFSQTTYPPNILFVLDLSGSMNENAGTTTISRLNAMQNALTDWLPTTENVNVGVFLFSGASSRMRLASEIEPVENDRDGLITLINGLDADGGTPTVRALWYANQYFNGELHETPTDNTSAEYDSPITSECQQNHVVLLTDGTPTAQVDVVADVEGLIYPGNTGNCATTFIVDDLGGEEGLEIQGICGAEMSGYMNSSDNEIVTHTIGFDFSDPWLTTLSEAGGGMHFEVDDADSLSNAFQSILDGTSSSFAAPTVATDSFQQRRHRDELFYAPFQPYGSVRWNGNIKKYKLVTNQVVDASGDTVSVPTVVDADDLPVFDDAGFVDPDSRSLWSLSDDGAEVLDGGFAAELPDFDERYWYTDLGVVPGAGGITTPIRVQSDVKDLVTVASLEATDEAERDTLIGWALGSDVEVDGTLSHQYAADSLHNSPVLLSYRADEGATPPERTEVLYFGNNMGVLNAIDPENGAHLWSYHPEEHLPNIKKYFDNENTQDHVYGLDGEFTLHSTRAATTIYDYEVDKAWLFMTERRGGDRVYGLDVTNGHSKVNPFKVMWKIDGGIDGPFDKDTDGDDINDAHWFADLAQTWSKPQLLSVQYGCPDACESKDVLMFSGGYNPIYDDVDIDYDSFTVPANGHGNAVYLVDPETGELIWSVGRGDHHSLNFDTPNNSMDHSVPSTPVPIDSDLDGYIDLLYFIDMSGDVWRVDFHENGADASELHKAGGKIAALSPAGQSLRFFNPIDAVLSGTSFSTAYYTLLTGSGMRSSPLHVEPDQNSLYAIKDRWVYEAPYRVNPTTDERQADYRYVTDSAGNHEVITASPDVLHDASDTTSTPSVEYGFFRTLESGEKILQPTTIHRNRVLSISYMPPDPDEVVLDCEPRLGETRLYLTSLPNGNNVLPTDLGDPYVVVGSGLKPGGQFVDTSDGFSVSAGDKFLSVDQLFGTDGQAPFRRFHRTGWVEKDGY